MRRVKQRIDSGAVCEQLVFNLPDGRKLKNAEPRFRFETEEDREKHRIGISRRHHARLVNTNFGPSSIYSTLTMDDEHEVHTFEEARRIRNNYVARLRRACPGAKIIIYMGRGKSTSRIHFHMLSDGVPAEVIEGKWKEGRIVRSDHLREHNYYNGVDHGQDYTGLANYLFGHWTPEQGGHHRFKPTRNLEQPRREEPRQVLREYSETRPPRTPKGYVLVEARATRYGLYYYKYVKIPPPRRKKKTEDPPDEG